LSFLLISVYRRSSQGMDERTDIGRKQVRAAGKYQRFFQSFTILLFTKSKRRVRSQRSRNA
jgi:hypothetical protein